MNFSEFANFVLKSIASYKTSATSTRLQKFSFESHYSCLLALDGRVDYMLNFALQNKVQELKLRSRYKGKKHIFDRNYKPLQYMYRFPEAIFSAGQIISLDLRGLRLEPPHITLSCPSIENFSLEDCHVLELIDEWTGQEWLHSCVLHNVEKLIVTRCNFRWNNARLCLDKLKSAVLKDCDIEAGEIEAPNLVWFEYWSYTTKVDRRTFSISSTSSLLNVKLLFNYDKYYPLDYPASEYLEKMEYFKRANTVPASSLTYPAVLV
ncbi:hypothetical protein FNV43_RR26456 [Rhamnella rubrinervis]|uniref:Uncharacterized protein n=1 Tax=Rhamnella rubrinervis TaxID=2594499 RepID=A0A8K0DJQ9_9ROSA|nr:hypothetical protein FNV43_RR26456 [Rhamnella rubrinervis]